ncbi:flavin-containing monooxygenase [Nocardia sp. NPDC060220]|uniref:flavin-containing monooxygenase n=1 Tax=Nocardia sp. NPDC060220 TaxID=3347076 RepID=UPI003665492F
MATAKPQQHEVVDIAIIGAGVSGLGAAYYFSRAFPTKRIVVLEGRDDIGGTWDLFKYPGIRSDSDLHTYGWDFKPWRRREAIAEGHLIREYMHEAVDEFGLASMLRLGHKVTGASWSSDDARWTLDVTQRDAEGKETTTAITTRWVFGGTGYYNYEEGYTPDIPGLTDFGGDILHPQKWPEHYDSAGKRVVVVGSGATAITMIPAMAYGPNPPAHITMLQRTPTYIVSLPKVDKNALRLTALLGIERGYWATREKNMWRDYFTVKFMERFPNAARKLIRSLNVKDLPKGFDVDTHFNPPYAPWDQRMCQSPDGDFFESIRDGYTSVVTDKITRVTRTGILLASGVELDADVIVTATGLNLQMFGGISHTVDGRRIDVADTVTYRGMLTSELPNWAISFGYTKSASWTMKVGMTSAYIIELIKIMEANGFDSVVPVPDPHMPTEPLLDLNSGYANRGKHLLPQQGPELPWRMLTHVPADRKLLADRPTIDGNLRFARAQAVRPPVQSNGAQPAKKSAAKTGVA